MKGSRDIAVQLAHARGLYQSGKIKHALGACRKLLKADPRNFDALCLATMVQAQLGKPADAARLVARALAVRPGNPGALNAQGNVMMLLGRHDAAAQSFSAAIAADPDFADAHFNLGNALAAQGRREEAIGAFNDALAVRPNWSDAIMARSTLFAVLDRHEEALAGFDDIIAREPRFIEAHYNRGLTLKKMERLEEALEAFRATVAINPGFIEAQNNLANTLRELDRPEEALTAYREVIRQKPDYAMGYYNLGSTLYMLRRHDEAITYFGEALRSNPDFPSAGFAMGTALLALGCYEQGWKYYDCRLRYTKGSPRPAEHYAGGLDVEQVSGDAARDLAGQSVFLYGEQGLGDEIMFASMVSDAANAVAALTMECEPRLKGLFARSFPDVRVLANGEAKPAGIERRYMIGSLAELFRNRAEDFPGTPYLVADPVRREKMRARLDALGEGRKIGIMWRGGIGGPSEKRRSMSLADMMPAMDREFHWISLNHLDQAVEEVAAFTDATGITVHHWPEILQSRDYDDTAALLAELDAVFTVTCTIGHCCGALGTPVHVLVPWNPEWRYGTEGATIPWYGSMTMYRQDAAGEWPFASVLAALRTS